MACGSWTPNKLGECQKTRSTQNKDTKSKMTTRKGDNSDNMRLIGFFMELNMVTKYTPFHYILQPQRCEFLFRYAYCSLVSLACSMSSCPLHVAKLVLSNPPHQLKIAVALAFCFSLQHMTHFLQAQVARLPADSLCGCSVHGWICPQGTLLEVNIPGPPLRACARPQRKQYLYCASGVVGTFSPNFCRA